jgi:3-oxoacyl-[acyl-carrier protein] reductase
VFGRWFAAAFAKAGAKLFLSDRAGTDFQSIISQLEGSGHIFHAADLTDPQAVAGLGAIVEQHWGAPDIVVNNAGVYPRGLLLDIDVEEWDRIFDINLRGPFLITREMAKRMIATNINGAIINISSGASRTMRTGSVPYCTSKTALERLSKGFALELAPHGIRVNVVEPGFAPGSTVSPLSEAYVERMKARIPLGRTSEPEDAAQAVIYLASDAASFITGAVLSVDGGNSIGSFEPGPLRTDDLRIVR